MSKRNFVVLDKVQHSVVGEENSKKNDMELLTEIIKSWKMLGKIKSQVAECFSVCESAESFMSHCWHQNVIVEDIRSKWGKSAKDFWRLLSVSRPVSSWRFKENGEKSRKSRQRVAKALMRSLTPPSTWP